MKVVAVLQFRQNAEGVLHRVARGERLVLSPRGKPGCNSNWFGSVERSDSLRLEWIGPERFYAGVALFRRHSEKEWSFTDCVSFIPMGELRMRDAFTTDHHFRPAGFVALL